MCLEALQGVPHLIVVQADGRRDLRNGCVTPLNCCQHLRGILRQFSLLGGRVSDRLFHRQDLGDIGRRTAAGGGFRAVISKLQARFRR